MNKLFKGEIKCPRCKERYKHINDIRIIEKEGKCIHCLDEIYQDLRYHYPPLALFTKFKAYGFTKWIDKFGNILRMDKWTDYVNQT